MNQMLQLFYLYCQLVENLYMDWKAYWLKLLVRTNQMDEHLPF